MGAGNMKKQKEVTKVMMKDDEAKTAIVEFMQAQNRPYSAQYVCDQL